MNLEFELGNKQKFKNIKIWIQLIPYSENVNSFKYYYTLNKKYNLVDFGDYFIPYYYCSGPFGGEILMKETYFQRYKEHENRVKKEYINKFIRTSNRNITSFYGYFESISKINREYNMKLKPYLLNTFIPYERITDKKLIDTIKNIRFK